MNKGNQYVQPRRFAARVCSSQVILLKPVIFGLLLLGIVFPIIAEEAHPYKITKKSGHEQEWKEKVWVTNSAGGVRLEERRITQLGTGLNYFNAAKGDWEPASAVFELDENGDAVARKLYHKVKIKANPKAERAVQVELADGTRLHSRVFGIALYSPVSGTSELIAELKEGVTGELELPARNRIIFRNCFDSIEASLVYEIGLGKFAQEIIFHKNIDLTQHVGFSRPEDEARLEIWSEFSEFTEPVKRVHVLHEEKNELKRTLMKEPDWKDETLVFSELSMIAGRAFENKTHSFHTGVPVAKTWHASGGGRWLIEAMKLSDISPLLSKLPLGQVVLRKKRGDVRQLAAAAAARQFRELEGSKVFRQGKILAQATAPLPGVVADYTMVVSSTEPYTFSAGKTYYVTSACNFNSVRLEPCVVKFARLTEVESEIKIQGEFDCATTIPPLAIKNGRVSPGWMSATITAL